MTDDGERRLKDVVEAAKRKEDWSAVLKGFPFVEEIENGRDLRDAHFNGVCIDGADLARTCLGRAVLSGALLTGCDLSQSDLDEADLSLAVLDKADLTLAHLTRADLSGANLMHARLFGATLNEANLGGCILLGADLTGTDLQHADLTGSDLTGCLLVKANMNGADISGARVFGVSAWGLQLDGTKQESLVITDDWEPRITVDDIQVAQFVYLLLHNERIRSVIDTITSKVVLILGRFTLERKAVLDAIRQELRQRNYTPVLFDFDKPASKSVTETVSTLAHLARFVIADLTDAKSIPQELQAIVPNLPSLAVQPLILKGQMAYGMFEHFTRYPWVLKTHEYETAEALIADIPEKIIAPAEEKAIELRPPAR